MQKQKNNKSNNRICTTSKFEEQVRACKDIADAEFKTGLDALTQAYRSKVQQGRRKCTVNGSVNVEIALEEVRMNEKRQENEYPKCCDYMIGFTKENRERIVFLEVHGAKDGEIANVVEKFDFIKRWLKSGGKEFRTGSELPKFCWVASGRSDISPNGRIKLSEKGVQFAGNCLTLDNF